MGAQYNGARAHFPPRALRHVFFPISEELLIIDAQMLLEDTKRQLSKDLERCKSFYSVHFPELRHIISDNKLFIQVVQRIGKRDNLPYVNLTDLLTLKVRIEIVKAAYTTKGTDISDAQMNDIFSLCNEVRTSWNHCAYLNKLLKIYMWRVAPNLTTLLGPKSAAKVIVHEGALKDIIRRRLSARITTLTKSKGKNTTNAKEAGEKTTAETVKDKASTGKCDKSGEKPSKDVGAASKEKDSDDSDTDDDSKESKPTSKEQVSEEEADDEESEVEVDKHAKGSRDNHKN